MALTHFMSLASFYTPWKHQKTSAFLIISGGIEKDQWHEMGKNMIFIHCRKESSLSAEFF